MLWGIGYDRGFGDGRHLGAVCSGALRGWRAGVLFRLLAVDLVADAARAQAA